MKPGEFQNPGARMFDPSILAVGKEERTVNGAFVYRIKVRRCCTVKSGEVEEEEE